MDEYWPVAEQTITQGFGFRTHLDGNTGCWCHPATVTCVHPDGESHQVFNHKQTMLSPDNQLRFTRWGKPWVGPV